MKTATRPTPIKKATAPKAHPLVVRENQPPVPVTDSTTLIRALARAAADPKVDVAKMKDLFQMHKELLAINAEADFNDAMARAEAKMTIIVRDAENTHTNSTYATLAAINEKIVPIYTAEGLSISFDTGKADNPAEQRTLARVSHSSGHSRDYHIDLPKDDVGAKGTTNKTPVHATGSTNMYGRRYLVCMIFNLATRAMDKDGNTPTGNELAESVIADYLSAIDAASDRQSLMKAYGPAYNAAAKAKDKASMKKFINAKDVKKAALGVE